MEWATSRSKARSEEGNFRSPAFMQSPHSSVVWNIENFTQFGDAGSASSHCSNFIFASVSGLLFVSCPFAIIFEVSERIIDAFKRETVRLYSHICEKIRKLHPAFADGYTSSAIVFILFVHWIEASFLHFVPRFSSRAVPASSIVSMSESVRAYGFPSMAPARKRSAAFKRVVARYVLIATHTLAKTARSVFFCCGFGYYFQSSKSYSDERYFFRHGVVFSISAALSDGRPAVTGARHDFDKLQVSAQGET